MEINTNAVLALVAEQQTIIMGLREENHQLRQHAAQALKNSESTSAEDER